MSTPHPPEHRNPAGQAPFPAGTGAPPPDGREEVDHLPTAECWTLLEGTQLGRLAVTRDDGTPDLFPVNYLTHEGALYIRTARDSKLMHIAGHSVVAFEVDGETESAWWSVVVKGPAQRVVSDAEIRDSGVQELVSWSPTRKHYVVRITPDSVTGRRFRKGSEHADSVAPPPTPVHTEPAESGHDQSRSQRPQAIPHYGPTDTGRIPVVEPPGEH